MNLKSFQVFYILILLLVNTNQSCDINTNTCTSCETTNCNTCDYGGCLTCLSGYYMDNEKNCIPCGNGCETCSNTGLCEVCSSDYYLENESCLKCSNTKFILNSEKYIAKMEDSRMKTKLYA